MLKEKIKSNCTFCQIIQKNNSDAMVLWENKDVICFLPLKIEVFGHVLVAPKLHFKSIFDINSNQLKKLISGVQFMAKHLKKVFKAEGINILNANGKEAQQSVAHLHFHIMPRFSNDKLDLWPKIKEKSFNKIEIYQQLKKGL